MFTFYGCRYRSTFPVARELPRNAFPRIPRKKWRELIQKVWETDPFICPNCARTMRIVGRV